MLDTVVPMVSPTPSVSLIVPLFNESERISGSLREMAAYLQGQAFESEIVLVDDGSTDDTVDVVRALAGDLSVPVRLLQYDRNRGKGFALKVGFEAASGSRLVFSDCDLSTPIDEMPRFLSALGEVDMAIGTRKAKGAELVRRQPRIRESLGVVFTMIVRVLIAPVSDATCGFKAFNHDVGKDLFARQRIEGWSFDAELLLIARRCGYRWREIPVRWEDRDGTKVRLMRDIVGSLVGIAQIRMNDLRGRYASRVPTESVREERFGCEG